MIDPFLDRTKALIGEKNISKLINSKVGILGLGGVGGAAFEIIVRTGINNIIIVDYDKVDITNLNRQILTNRNNVGEYKIDVAEKRGLSINPNLKITKFLEKISEENITTLQLNTCDYVIDCIDDVDGKLQLIKYCKSNNIPVISAMGSGKRIDPTKLEITDIYKTRGCPLARKMRQQLRKENIDSLKVVYSTENPIKENPGFIQTISYLPNLSGILLASEVIRDLINNK